MKTRLVLQWIPVHCGVDGNGETDKLSKTRKPRRNETMFKKEQVVPGRRQQKVFCHKGPVY